MSVLTDGLGKRSEEVLIALRQDIREGRLLPGTKLPSERDLCKTWSASRSTVRRAISRLAMDNLVTVRPKSGAVVREWREPTIDSSMISVMFSFDTSILADLQRHAIGKDVLICPYPRTEMGWDPALERAFLERVLRERHRGLLAFCTPTPPRNDLVLRELDAAGVHVLHVEHYRTEPPDQPYMLPDYRRAGHMAAVRLLLAGYATVICTKAACDWPGALLLRQGFGEAVADQRGAAAAQTCFYEYPLNARYTSTARAELARMVRAFPKPVGILCTSPTMAGEILDAAAAAGIACPEELGVIAAPFTDFPMENTRFDIIDFGLKEHLKRALDCVAAPEWTAPREWLSPRITQYGSVRE